MSYLWSGIARINRLCTAQNGITRVLPFRQKFSVLTMRPFRRSQGWHHQNDCDAGFACRTDQCNRRYPPWPCPGFYIFAFWHAFFSELKNHSATALSLQLPRRLMSVVRLLLAEPQPVNTTVLAALIALHHLAFNKFMSSDSHQQRIQCKLTRLRLATISNTPVALAFQRQQGWNPDSRARGQTMLLGISRRGSNKFRTLLVQFARRSIHKLEYQSGQLAYRARNILHRKNRA